VLRAEFSRDGFAEQRPIVLDRELKSLSFGVENRTGDRHAATIRLSLPAGTTWDARVNGKGVPIMPVGTGDYPASLTIEVGTGSTNVALTRK
jgi:hypothetical protein